MRDGRPGERSGRFGSSFDQDGCFVFANATVRCVRIAGPTDLSRDGPHSCVRDDVLVGLSLRLPFPDRFVSRSLTVSERPLSRFVRLESWREGGLSGRHSPLDTCVSTSRCTYTIG
ncbi:hypothetical protein CYV19_08420 [Natronobacterium gregoryi SP2]|uniref:Uncharacterized protein n=1 Tax=Natronobacterium gregoryi (strain ATCC 43098 / DSM 3393 / CCM 3738 / CIP 104747 / IAM 13177 / JCM 8860 / NBRC 102187 / NCIMB 2189 / SP2) TaxID=797304 RepID=L9Y602_NATGS|nr:hypothetical protein C490_08646 [Natronobacterium gregoryi SP2]PLK20619.1 hypothetical protein CYV19_08420 [Natronobacterium gregoryi SP2]